MNDPRSVIPVKERRTLTCRKASEHSDKQKCRRCTLHLYTAERAQPTLPSLPLLNSLLCLNHEIAYTYDNLIYSTDGDLTLQTAEPQHAEEAHGRASTRDAYRGGQRILDSFSRKNSRRTLYKTYRKWMSAEQQQVSAPC